MNLNGQHSCQENILHIEYSDTFSLNAPIINKWLPVSKGFKHRIAAEQHLCSDEEFLQEDVHNMVHVYRGYR